LTCRLLHFLQYFGGHVRSCAPAQPPLFPCGILHPYRSAAPRITGSASVCCLTVGGKPMKKATHADAVLIARSMNMKVDVVWDIIGGMNYASYSELVMAVLICLKPLPLERFTSSDQ